MSDRSSGTPDKALSKGDQAGASKPRTNLKELGVGDAARIVGFLSRDEAIKKIEAMGLRVGKRITVLKKLGRGILVKTSNSRIVITSDVAKNIEVE